MNRHMGVVVFALALAGALGCKPSRTADEALADLSAPQTEVRLGAARDLESLSRDQRGLPPRAVDGLLERFPTETDPKTRGAMITALGYTGDPRVKPLLDPYLQTTDPDQQRWGARAYKKYVVKIGQYPPNHDFPDGWPYGTPGFPAPAP